jgi:hypothetical protein
MNKFENLNHRGKLIYNGHSPMRTLQAPDEGSGDLYGFYGQGGFGSQHSQDFDRHVRHVPDPLPNVFPGNPGPETQKASFDERFPRGVWSGGRGPSIDAAFSGDDPSKTEFPLGRALRKKAERMK